MSPSMYERLLRKRFNTASGSYCCNLFKSFISLLVAFNVSIPQAVGTVTSLPLFSPPFGQGLEMCGPHRRFAPLLPRTLRRIPQTVGTFTSSPLFSLPFSQGLEMCGPHRRFAPLLSRTLRRIPQAVDTVATLMHIFKYALAPVRFNTASGRYCYFITFVFPFLRSGTKDVRASSSLRSSAASHPSSHTASGKKHCCNQWGLESQYLCGSKS